MPSTYARQSFLNKKTTGVFNASLNGIPLRLNPTQVNLSYQVKTSETPTLGGMVVQVFGVEMGDLTITGTFGKGWWGEQLQFLENMLAIATGQGTQPGLAPSGPPVRFVYPQRNFDFQVYLKAYSDPNAGMAIDYENQNISPEWQLTLMVDNDNTGGALLKVAADAYIQRLANGLGYALSPYNGNLSTQDIENFLQSQGYANNPLGYLNAAFGAPNQQQPQTTGSSAAGGGPNNFSGSGNVQIAYNFFVGKGLKNFQAAGIVGNLMQESGVNPESKQIGGGPGRGIAQWSLGGRWKPELMTGNETADLQAQLQYVWTELNSDYSGPFRDLQNTTTVEDATRIFCTEYEAAGIPNLQSRINNAKSVLSQFGGG